MYYTHSACVKDERRKEYFYCYHCRTGTAAQLCRRVGLRKHGTHIHTSFDRRYTLSYYTYRYTAVTTTAVVIIPASE